MAGKDGERRELTLERDATCGSWRVLAEGHAAQLGESRSAILAALQQAAAPLGPKAIAAATGLNEGKVKNLLGKMVRSRDVRRGQRGEYTPTDPAPPPAEAAQI